MGSPPYQDSSGSHQQRNQDDGFTDQLAKDTDQSEVKEAQYNFQLAHQSRSLTPATTIGSNNMEVTQQAPFQPRPAPQVSLSSLSPFVVDNGLSPNRSRESTFGSVSPLEATEVKKKSFHKTIISSLKDWRKLTPPKCEAGYKNVYTELSHNITMSYERPFYWHKDKVIAHPRWGPNGEDLYAVKNWLPEAAEETKTPKTKKATPEVNSYGAINRYGAVNSYGNINPYDSVNRDASVDCDGPSNSEDPVLMEAKSRIIDHFGLGYKSVGDYLPLKIREECGQLPGPAPRSLRRVASPRNLHGPSKSTPEDYTRVAHRSKLHGTSKSVPESSGRTVDPPNFKGYARDLQPATREVAWYAEQKAPEDFAEPKLQMQTPISTRILAEGTFSDNLIKSLAIG
jgi:hypothetical protein